MRRTKNGHSAHAGARNIGPSALDRWTAAGRSWPCTQRHPAGRWCGGRRWRVTSESVCSAAKACCRCSLKDRCRASAAPPVGAACTGSSALQRSIDRGRSDLCSERQHGSQLLRLAFHAALLHCREKQPGARARTARWLWPPHSTQLLGSSALHAIILVCRIFPTHLGDSEWCVGSNGLFSTGIRTSTRRIGVQSVRDGHVRRAGGPARR